MTEQRGGASSLILRLACGFFFACVLFWLALRILAEIWGWLLLVAFIVAAVWMLASYLNWRRTRRW